MTEIVKAGQALDLEEVMSSQAMDVLTRGTDEAFLELAGELDIEEMVDAVTVLTQVSKYSSLRAGYLFYQMRLKVPDGTWGTKVYEFAEQYGVSERTIHRWMKAAQGHFGLELTAAQKNAESAATPDNGRRVVGDIVDDGPDWDDDDDPFAGLDGIDDELHDPDADDRMLLDLMNDQAGWGDDTLPEVQRGTPNEDAQPAPRAPLVEPDPDWVAFTATTLNAEHDNSYPEETARRLAVARWQNKLENEPLELLEELETIYEARGQEVPDDVAEKLMLAEETKAIKPDAVEQPKKGRGGQKFAYSQAEKLLQAARNLHEYVFTGLRDGTIDDKEVAGMLPHLEPMPHSIKGLREMALEAKKRAVADAPPKAAERIAATQAAEAEKPEF